VPEGNTNVVVDNLTGLMWTRNANVGTGGWDLAVGACYFTPRFGYEDWRLPTIREMESLIDMGEFDPALPLSHPFTNMANHHWTSTGNINNTNQAWKISVGRWLPSTVGRAPTERRPIGPCAPTPLARLPCPRPG
jgi:hypothetical protein